MFGGIFSKKLKCKFKGELLWLSGKVVKNEIIKEMERTRVRSPPRATSFYKKSVNLNVYQFKNLI
jgi:hypothetical protein